MQNVSSRLKGISMGRECEGVRGDKRGMPSSQMGKLPQFEFSDLNTNRRYHTQGSAKRRSPGLVNFVPAVDTTSAWPCLQNSRNLGTIF